MYVVISLLPGTKALFWWAYQNIPRYHRLVVQLFCFMIFSTYSLPSGYSSGNSVYCHIGKSLGYNNCVICCSLFLLCGGHFCAWCTCGYEMPRVIGLCCHWFICCSDWFEDDAESVHCSHPPRRIVFIWSFALKILNLCWWYWQVKSWIF